MMEGILLMMEGRLSDGRDSVLVMLEGSLVMLEGSLVMLEGSLVTLEGI